MFATGPFAPPTPTERWDTGVCVCDVSSVFSESNQLRLNTWGTHAAQHEQSFLSSHSFGHMDAEIDHVEERDKAAHHTCGSMGFSQENTLRDRLLVDDSQILGLHDSAVFSWGVLFWATRWMLEARGLGPVIFRTLKAASCRHKTGATKRTLLAIVNCHCLKIMCCRLHNQESLGTARWLPKENLRKRMLERGKL